MRIILPLTVLVLAIAVVVSPQLLRTQELTITRGSAPKEEIQNQIINEIQKRDDLLLPDLRISSPKQLYLESRSGKRYLRFSTTFSNIGSGPLELHGANDPVAGVTVATQVMQKTDGTTERREVGAFVYHPGHSHLHWHVEKYSQFELLKINEAGDPTETLAQTDKMSFCIWDEHTSDLSIPNAAKSRKYSRCPRSNIQGMSVGWGDTYMANVEGQELDITGIPDGTYAARSVINVDRKIMESDYSNNIDISYIQLLNNSVKIVDPNQ